MRIARLKVEAGLDRWHQRGFDRHGGLYIVRRIKDGIVEAKSVATGKVCSLLERYLEIGETGSD